MNILLTSVGRRSYLVKYFKEALNGEGKVFVSNSDNMTPSFEFADGAVVTPLIYDENYINFLKNYCLENKISLIISLFDIDLLVLAKHKQEFEELGIRIIVSDEKIIKICNDKWETFMFLKNKNFNVPKTYIDIESVKQDLKNKKLNYPLILKPRWGMGSIGLYEAENNEELEVLYRKVENKIEASYLKYESKNTKERNVLIQEKLKGQEYGLDIINDLEGNYCTTIVKKKNAMRAGETDCAETINSKDLKLEGKKVSRALKHVGNLDLDLFLCDGKDYVLEMNARFGGGYPFSHLAGVNLPLAIVKWAKEEKVDINSILKEKENVIGHKNIEIVKI
ncbi:ATP-grasp domain-containing protein [Fusobacterium sp. MFO224]|uniref:ATP-grasp domain-containing protein n=1 Tax=Fusobacterium sp. MFO224 TaxID=3378070 RepID=UPI0038547EF2